MAILDAREARPTEGGASFSRRSRLVRAVWKLTWALLAAWTPPPFHAWRVLLLRLFGADVAWSAHVYGSARIWTPSNLQMGEHACLGPRVECYCMAPVRLGRGAIVSQNAHLCAGGHDIDDPAFQLVARPITIGAQAWVAADAFVGPGAEVGEGAVVAARAVLFGRAEPWTVYAGNPARVLRPRAKAEARR